MKENTVKKEIIEWIQVIVVGVVLATLVTKFVLFVAEIPSVSMEPTLKVGDRIIVNRVYNLEKLKTGDIVVFYCEEDDSKYIKRLIGLPGDTVTMQNGDVFVNGQKLNDEYVIDKGDFSGEYKVPEGKYFFLGDNRTNSKDSRYLKEGFIDAEDIIGKSSFKLYPFNDFGKFN